MLKSGGGCAYFTVDENGMVNDATVAKLNALKPASYYLKFFVDEVRVTGSTIVNVKAYSDVARDGAGNPMATVTVSKATNSWTSTPNVTRWTYGEYDSDVHTITAVALYPALLPKDENGKAIEGFTYTNGGAALPEVQFVVYNGNTEVTDLSELHAGTYTLATSMGGSDYYTEISETRMSFTVGKAVNTWTTTPQVVQWTWGAYSADRNIISAATNFTGGDGTEGSADKPILFTVFDGDRSAVTDLENFRVGSDGKIIDNKAAAAFAALHAGSYYLRAEKLGNNDYTDITGSNSTDIPFTVGQANNSWKTSPSIIGWIYGSFEDDYFTTGVPTFTKSGESVKYTLTKLNDSTFNKVEFTDRSKVDFASLNVGSYTLTATYAGTDDFDKLEATLAFTVNEYTNGWNPSPSLRGWSYKSFNAGLFTAGKPTRQDDKNAVVTYEVTGGKLTNGKALTVNNGALSTDSVNFLTALASGSYTLKATYPGTVNYKAITASIDFEVSKITNSWVTTPSVIGWIYGSFNDSYFTRGVPRFNESKDAAGNAAQVEYTLTKDGDGEFEPVKFTSGYDFKNLNAGSYKINVYYAASDNYDELTALVTFTVGKCTNSWATKPRVIDWTYGSFDASYCIAGVPTLADDSVKVEYTLTKDGDGEFTPVTFTEFSENDFKNLNAGSYKLTVWYAGTVDYGSLSDEVHFTVRMYTNTWATRPSLLGWTYSAFSAEYFTAGVPTRQDDKDAVVTYEVTGGKLTSSVTLTVNNGTLSPASVNSLTALAAGSYTLKVSYPGTDNYEEMKAEDTVITFQVSPVNNSWDKQPAITGFVYKQFSAGNNFIAGVPHYPLKNKEVHYVIADSVISEVKTLADFEKITGKHFTLTGTGSLVKATVDYLNGLGKGTYRFAVFVPADTNYSYLFYTGSFGVSQTGNNWVDGVSPDISGWTYHAFDESLFSNGTAEHGTVVYTVEDSKGNTPLSGNYDTLKGQLNGLNAGTYTLHATSGSTQDYTEVTWSKQFVVAKADNEWKTLPSIKGWVYGEEHGGPDNGEAKYEDAGISGKYYLATTDGSGNPIADTKEVSAENAGNYAYVLTVANTTNYNGFKTTLFFTVEKAANGWKTKPDTTVNWVYKADDNAEIVFEANQNNNKLQITVGGETVIASTLNTTLGSYGVGRYSIVASVPAEGNYGALEMTVTLVIERAQDSFGEFNVPDWEWDDVSQKTDENGVAWQTKWNTELSVPVPAEGTTATAIVYKGTAEELAVTLHYETGKDGKQVLATDLNALKTKLLGLHVYGSYKIEFTIAESANYKGCTVNANFAVTKVSNNWDGQDGTPRIAGWQYEGSVANPTATPMFGKGTVKFSYAKAGEETKADLIKDDSKLTWNDSTDTAEGTYWLRAEVPGTDDYNYLVDYVKFSIKAGQNGWVNNPGVIAWNWNGYQKAVNLFSGSAKNGGEATIRIYAGSGRSLEKSDFVFNGETPDNITDSAVGALFGTYGFTLEPMDKVMVVSDDVAKYLNALKPGTYSLTVTIAADNNYDTLDGSATFVVGKAVNSWKENSAPAVSSYTYGNTAAFTAGETVYGAKEAVIYRLTGTTYEDDEYTKTFESTGNKAAYAELQEELATLDAGTYTLSAWVEESANGTYSALYSEISPYTARSFTVARATNGWTNEKPVPPVVGKPYAELHNAAFDETKFTALYEQLTALDGTVNYALLNADYTSRNTDALEYAGLFEAIKALPSGEYVIRATVAQTNNYLAIAATDTRLTISKYDNEFTSIPASLTAQWARDVDKNNATVLTDFEVKANHGESTVTYTLGTTTYTSYDGFEAAVKALDAGSYNVTIAITGTDEYVGLSAVRMLTVKPASNSWQNGWSIGGSLSAADPTAKANNSWAWKSTVTWTRAVPLYGTTVYVEIRKKGASAALQYITVDYGVNNGDSAVETVGEAISRLDVGDYELIVSAPSNNNWGALLDKTGFSVTKVENDWKTAPYITGAKDNKWEYGATVIPNAEAKYGSVRFEYATKAGKKLDSMPTASGEYVIKFIVDESDNYGGVSGGLNVTIEKTTNRNFSTALGVDGWAWGSYDRATNVFRGTPEITALEHATVKFSVGTGTGEDFVALPGLEEFTLKDGHVKQGSAVEAALRALTGGDEKTNRTTYTLRIHVSGTANYNGFVQDNTFAVTGATNTWTKSPTIVPWIVNNWTDEYLPSAASLYGAPEIIITGEADGKEYFKGAYKETENGLTLDEELNKLNLAPEGYYVMTTSVKAVIGQYSALLESYRFRINVKGTGEANYWEVLPNINGWEANIDGQHSMPEGKPVRGLPNFVFYVREADGKRGQKVDASLTNVVLEKTDKYEADIYIPVEPGDYYLVASSKGIPTEEGKSDALAEFAIRVIIDARPISFDEELRISTLMYLGDRVNWENPTSKATLADAVYEYVYTNKETGETSLEMPTKAGKYTVTATIYAKYSNSVSMSVDFTVALSLNSWVSAPNIKDWSEEFDPNSPTGTSSVGSEQIKYTYANVKEPDKILTETPTNEGTYVMYADVEVDGYEPLHAEYLFTIEPAFDSDLLLVDIVLGLVACAMAIVVIVYAVRRYREN